MNDEYDDGYEGELRLSIVDELTPRLVDDEPMPPADPPALRVVEELVPVEVDDEPVLAAGVLVIVSDEQLQSALRDPELSDEFELEPAADGESLIEEASVEEASIEDASSEDELATEDEPVEDTA